LATICVWLERRSMAKIFVAFANGILDSENPNAMPAFYESFVKGLDKAGNEVCLFQHRLFGMEFGEIDEDTAAVIKEFRPEICFIFNNCFYDISDIVDCPIIIYEVDSPCYFSNKENLRKRPERYTYFLVQEDSKKILVNEWGIDEKLCFYVPFFTEVQADDSIKTKVNISFIGSMFESPSSGCFEYFMQNAQSEEEWEMMRNCIKYIRKNPQVTREELIYKFGVTSETVASNLYVPSMLMMLSTERRLKVLSSVEPLGLDLYGTKNWAQKYFYNIDLNLAYVNKRVYSLQHNQDIYNSSKIGINVSHYQATSGFPWRVMDIMASNACLVTDYHSDFKKVFGNIELPIYESESEAYEVCRRLINDESRRKDIVLRCQEVINEKYRFKHFLAKIEEYIGVKLHV